MFVQNVAMLTHFVVVKQKEFAMQRKNAWLKKGKGARKRYLGLVGVLYGSDEKWRDEALIEEFKLKPVKAKKVNETPPEWQDQMKLVIWLKETYPELKFTASANGEYRNAIIGAKLKRMGVSCGFPDLEIPSPRKPYHGLYIELKRLKGGIVSSEQKEWILYLRKEGYYADVALGCEAAKVLVQKYLMLPMWE